MNNPCNNFRDLLNKLTKGNNLLIILVVVAVVYMSLSKKERVSLNLPELSVSSL